MPDLYLGGFCAVLDLGENLWFNPDALMRDPLRIGLCPAHERREFFAQDGCRGLGKAVVDLARIDQVLSLAPADIKAAPFAAVERIAGNGQGLALCAGLLDPVIAAAGNVAAVPDFRSGSRAPPG